MKLIKASYEIITTINGEEILKQIELAARTCYKSEDKIEYGSKEIVDYFAQGMDNPIKHIVPTGKAKSARILVSKLIRNNHEAMLEFGGNITVKFICDRGVSHELVRHRIASFAQESTRYCNYGKDEHISFIIPSWCETTIHEGICNNSTNDIRLYCENTWLKSMLDSETRYNTLISNGWSPQQARSVLPNSLKTEINISTNIREWRHIFKLRCSNAAHPDMRAIMRPLLDEFKSKVPILFDDIN